MSRIREALTGGRGLVCYMTAGFPSYEQSIELAMACVRGGADVIEIGVPFSDPVADGRTIQLASQRALEGGMTPRRVFDLVRDLRRRTEVPVVLMGYYNPIFKIGDGEYVRLASGAGVDGLIVPDMPMEESMELRKICSSSGVDLIQLVGPTTTQERMGRIAAASSGFLYVVSALGTTGARRDLPEDIGDLIRRARGAARGLPVAVGFGVSRPEHAGALYRSGADAVIVGSAIIQLVMEGRSAKDVEEFVHQLRSGR